MRMGKFKGVSVYFSRLLGGVIIPNTIIQTHFIKLFFLILNGEKINLSRHQQILNTTKLLMFRWVI